MGSGATFAEVSKAQVEGFEIPLPPLADQERVATWLTRGMQAAEAARCAANDRLAAAESLPAALLREVFEGPGAERWETRRLGDICTGPGQYGTSKRSNGEERGVPVLGMPHIHQGRIRWRNVSFVELTPAEEQKYRLLAGDILFNRTNSAELVGKTAVFDGAREAVFASYLIRYRVRRDVADPRFVSAFVNSRAGRAYIGQHMARAIGQVPSTGQSDLPRSFVRSWLSSTPCPLRSFALRSTEHPDAWPARAHNRQTPWSGPPGPPSRAVGERFERDLDPLRRFLKNRL